MHVGIHIHSAEPLGQAVAAGFQALGWRTSWRNGTQYKSGQTEPFDLIAVDGLRNSRRALVDDYARKGIRSLVIDLGYFRDVPGYWQVGMGGLNAIPPFPCPPDRFHALGLPVQESGGRSDGWILVAGQRPDDASHGMSVRQYEEWLAKQVGRVRKHPLESPSVSPLADDLSRTRLVRTVCSTAGLDALLAGVPAVAERPERAVWGELSGEKLPSMTDRMALFSRIAYGQWTLPEIASGEAIQFTLSPPVPEIDINLPALGTQPKKRRTRKVKA